MSAVDRERGLAEFEKRVRGFLERHCPRRRGPVPLVRASFATIEDEDGHLTQARRYQAALFDAGLAWLAGPREYGGAELGEAEAEVFLRVAEEFDVPDRQNLAVGLKIVAPAIAAYGTADQKARWLPAIFRGDIVACQLFSEPEAGSDLASLRTRAVRDGDGWRVSGQKIWSSGAFQSQIGELLARTSDDPRSRSRGLSMFIIDMSTPGVTVRRIRQMNGSAHFCEVFFDNVHVPDDCRLGPPGHGWAVANVSLSSERGDLNDGMAEPFIDLHGRLVALARERGLTDDPDVTRRLVDSFVRREVGALLAESLAHSPSAAPVAPSLTKLYHTTTDWRLAEHAAAILGPTALVDVADDSSYAWRDVILAVSALRIAGGTDQIQRNIIAERGLGLPREAPNPPTHPDGATKP